MDVLRLHGPDRGEGAAGGHGGSSGGGSSGSGGGPADSMDGVALAGAGSNMNVAAVKAHLWADLGENVTVIAAGVIMVLRPAWRFVDPLFSLIVAAGVLISNAPLVREALYILCEWAPATVDVSSVADRVAATPGVAAVEQLRVWSISSTRVCATVHVALPRTAVFQHTGDEPACLLAAHRQRKMKRRRCRSTWLYSQRRATAGAQSSTMGTAT